MDKLKIRLETIEEKIGGTEPQPPFVDDALDWHLKKIENLIEESSSHSSGTKLYRHAVTDGTRTYVFVCEIAEEITDFSAYSDRKFVLENPYLDTNNHGYVMYIGYKNSGGNKATTFGVKVYFNPSATVVQQNTIEEYYSGIYTALTDTVTEL